MSDLLDALAIALKSALGFQAIFFALLAIGLNMHFGYTGLLNFGQIAFAMLGGFGIAISVTQWGLPFWVGVAGRLRRRRRAGTAAGPADPAAAGRLPGDRRRSRPRRGCGCCSGRCRRRRSPAAPAGLAFNGDFIALAPWDTSSRYRILGTQLERRRAVGGAVGWLLVVLFSLLVWLLVAQPVGPGAQVDPRGRGRRPRAGQERLRLQDAVAGPRRCDRRLRRHGLRRRAPAPPSPTSTRTPTRSSPTPH